jgi:hypothetical protein
MLQYNSMIKSHLLQYDKCNGDFNINILGIINKGLLMRWLGCTSKTTTQPNK